MAQQLVGTLQFYNDQSGNLFALDPTTNQTFHIAGASAPASDPTKVAKAGDTMTGPLNVPTVQLPAGSNPGGNTPFLYTDSSDHFVHLNGQVAGLFLNNIDGSNVPTLVMMNPAGSTYTKLSVDANGDVIASAWVGPSAGKSVNLTQAFAGNVAKSGGTMTGTLTASGNPPITVTGAVGNDSLVTGSWGYLSSQSGNFEVPAQIRYGVSGSYPYIAIDKTGIYLNSPAGQHQHIVAQDNGDILLGVAINTGIQIDQSGAGGPTTRLYVNATTGDLMVTQTTGPNAGKSVNLTSGKWA